MKYVSDVLSNFFFLVLLEEKVGSAHTVLVVTVFSRTWILQQSIGKDDDRQLELS